jgi:hypothetical protein
MEMSASQPTSQQDQTAAEKVQAEADRLQAEADRLQAEANKKQAEARRMQTGGTETSSEALTNLRGSSVAKVNTRQVGQVILILTLVTLFVLAVVFLVAGVHRNNQITGLHEHGVPAVMTVTECAVLIGGSGSTPAGDSCRGTFTLDGHHYAEAIPGSAEYDTGQQLHIVVVPNDPALLAPRQVAVNEHTSWTTFILPAILFVAFLLLLGWAIALHRRRSEGSS